MGRPWSKNWFTKCLNSIKPAAIFYLKNEVIQNNNEPRSSSLSFSTSNSSSQTSISSNGNLQEERTNSNISNDGANPTTPALFSPNNNPQHNIFNFGVRQNIDHTQLDEEIFETKIENEINEFIRIISKDNYFIISRMDLNLRHLISFFNLHGNELPNLKKLAYIFLSINSSSACIERFFNICGFTSKKIHAIYAIPYLKQDVYLELT